MTAVTDPCDVADARPMRPVPGRSVELRCGVCWRRSGYRTERCVAVAHVNADGLCVHERPQGGHKGHVTGYGSVRGYPCPPSTWFERDDDETQFMATVMRPRCKHRLAGTPADVVTKMERGETVVYLEAA